MLLKHVTVGLAGSVLLATVAFAQTAATDGANMTPARMSDSSLRGDWRTSKVVGLSVYNDNNQSIGSINDLLTDKNGNIKAVVLGVGGFLGMAGTSNGAGGSRPASAPITTGAATGTSTGAASGSGPVREVQSMVSGSCR